jgi:hypothetical protein
VDVHEFEFGHAQLLTNRVQIDRLPARHAARSRRSRENLDHIELDRGIVCQLIFRNQLKREALERCQVEPEALITLQPKNLWMTVTRNA